MWKLIEFKVGHCSAHYHCAWTNPYTLFSFFSLPPPPPPFAKRNNQFKQKFRDSGSFNRMYTRQGYLFLMEKSTFWPFNLIILRQLCSQFWFFLKLLILILLTVSVWIYCRGFLDVMDKALLSIWKKFQTTHVDPIHADHGQNCK